MYELTPAAYHILLALAEGDRHGYAIMQDIERMTDGNFSIGAGTLYRSIKRLLKDGLIAEVDPPEGVQVDDERRRYYRLTPAGLRVVQAETERLAQTVYMAQQTLRGAHGS
jgi:DNA-binding PadR family transcriptional regulator